MIYDYSVEQAVLGCVIFDNDLLKKCDFDGDIFYNQKHKQLWGEIQKIYKKNGIVDLTMLNDFDCAIDIMTTTYIPSNFNIYKTRLQELSKKREFLKVNIEIKKDIENAESIEELKALVLSKINAIKVEKSSNESFSDSLIKHTDFLEKVYNGEEGQNYKWGIDFLDKVTGGVYPTYTILSARPSIGKTAMSLQLLKNIAKQGANVAFFSLETRKHQIVTRLIASEGLIDKDTMEKSAYIKKLEWEKYARTINSMLDLNIKIHDDVFTIEEILMRAEEQRSEKGLDFLVLDYIQLTNTKKNYSSLNEKVSYISRELKQFQNRTGCHVLALSQFSRQAENAETPNLSHLRDSGSLEQDGRIILFMYETKESKEQNDGNFKEVILEVAKNSEGEKGTFKKLKFYGKTQRFYE